MKLFTKLFEKNLEQCNTNFKDTIGNLKSSISIIQYNEKVHHEEKTDNKNME